jgi:predicted ATPase
MRLDRLAVADYRNLRSFEIDFDENQPITVLLGHNGTGKSNLIEVIVEIFRDLEIGATPKFAYSMEYVCRDHKVKVDADPARSNRRVVVTIDEKAITQTALHEELDTVLPNHVFAYYSGWSTRLERQFDRPTRRHYNLILNSKDKDLPLRRLFYCRKEYSQLVLLAFFLATPSSVRALLQHYLGIKRFESALFVLKTPWWGEIKPNKARQREADPRFWYARGAFTGFLDRLWDRALAPIRNLESVERDIRRQGEKTERLYLFIKDQAQLEGLKETHDEPKDLFGYLESLFLCDLIDEVRVTVERTDGTRLNFTQMSEGEQQLLTVLGLLLFTQNEESLYLLDEPDTHLNPVWAYDFLKLLQDNIRAEKGQLIVATHDPLMIGSLHKSQVRLLVQEKDRIIASEPEYDPMGIGVEGLLKSELYGLRSTLAPEVLRNLDRHYYLLGKRDRTDDEDTELRHLATQLNELGVARTHPNPYFELFANAMARRRVPEQETTLSKEEINSQTKLADEVLEEVLADEKVAGKDESA